MKKGEIDISIDGKSEREMDRDRDGKRGDRYIEREMDREKRAIDGKRELISLSMYIR